MIRPYYLAIVTAFLFVACGESTPKRQLAFFNNSNRTLNIVIENEEFNFYDAFLEPQSVSFYYSDTGTFNFVVYEEDGAFLRESLNFKIEENKGNICNYLWTDLEGIHPVAVVNFNALYESGGNYAQAVRQYQSTELVYKYIENTQLPFEPEIVYQCEMVNPYDAIPSSIDVGDNVYGIVPLDQEYTNLEDLNNYLSIYIEKYN